MRVATLRMTRMFSQCASLRCITKPKSETQERITLLIAAHEREMERSHDLHKEYQEATSDELEFQVSRLQGQLDAQQKEISKFSSTEEALISDKVGLLHRVAQLRNAEPAKASLEIIDSLYRRRLEEDLGRLSPGPQSVLSEIIKGALDTPLRTYAYSRNRAISLVDSELDSNDVDNAGHCIYESCRRNLMEGYTNPVILRHEELVDPSIAAFFALAHFCDRARISVEHQSCGVAFARL
ncbi:hypothetical protein ARMSODRAFT_1014030 [Armillaria solidipes]|uniref:Uncharacterized protein n=1 Tax=Armillaria solidipes TaxID=1076256 RepID=A0A2H3C9R9_9AGAR|nr:hypothetical protein ARMSODRAFT_1014030 [Armillaria solidipes]